MSTKFTRGVEGFLVYVVMIKRSDEYRKIIVAICNPGLATSTTHCLRPAFDSGIPAYLSAARFAKDPQLYLLLRAGGGFSCLSKPLPCLSLLQP
jgi:hypothetical protein